MDKGSLRENLAEHFVAGWDIIATGSGFLIVTDWRWPNRQAIELLVRTVGEREDLFVVTDGGELLNFLFAEGVDLTRDGPSLKTIEGVLAVYQAELADYQIVKAANDQDLASAVRLVLEAVKDCSLVLWHKLKRAGVHH